MEIIEVDHSIANRFDGYIEINENLKNYPELLKPILEHELSHTDKTFTWHDFKLDFVSKTGVNYFDLLKFMFKHPRSFLQLSPILIINRKLILDINLFIMYSLFFLTFIGTIYVGVKYL